MSIAFARSPAPAAVRKVPPFLSREAFGRRFRWSLVDPEFEIASDAIAEIEKIAWHAYRDGRSSADRAEEWIAEPCFGVRPRVMVVVDGGEAADPSVAHGIAAARHVIADAGLEIDVFDALDEEASPDACSRWAAAHGVLMIAADPARALRQAAACGALQVTHDRGSLAYAFVATAGSSFVAPDAGLRWLAGIGMVDAIEQSRLDHFLDADSDNDDAAVVPLPDDDPLVDRVRHAARALAATLPGVCAGERTPADPLLARALCGV